MLGEDYTREFRAPSAFGFGLLVTEMQRNAAEGGRFAAETAMNRDLKGLIETRATSVKMFRRAFELIANQHLKPEERELVVKYGLMPETNGRP